MPRTDVDTAEGYRWVTRLASLAQDWFVEKGDPLHPQLFQLQDEYRKLLVDNPDVRYLFCVLDDTRSYRLTGTRGEAAYVGLTFGTPIGKGAVGGRTGTTTQVHLDEFELGPGGEVDLLIVPADQMPDPRPVNSIVLEPGTGQVAFRETFFDKRTRSPADLRIDLVGDVAAAECSTRDDLAGKLEFAGIFLQFVAATAVNMWHDTADNINPFGGTAGSVHVEAQDDEVRSHSDADMTYHGGRFVLGEDEALVVTVHEPDKEFLYWGLTITSPWMESYDYRYTTTNLNNRTGGPVRRRIVAAGDLAHRSRGWPTGSTPGRAARATCSCAGCWPTDRRIRRVSWCLWARPRRGSRGFRPLACPNQSIHMTTVTMV